MSNIANQHGFTLIEIIMVLVLLSLLAAIAVPRFLNLETSALERAIDSGIAELNSREALMWSKLKISPSGWQDDDTLFGQMNLDLGADYDWTSGPTAAEGGTLRFQRKLQIPVERTPSTQTRPGSWERQ